MMRSVVIAAGLWLLSAGTLTAEEALSLEWDVVPESRGYVVQLRRIGESDAKDFRVNENRLRTNLPTGEYDARVAGLNKFGKPGQFSEWVRIKLDRQTNQAPLNLSKPAAIQPASDRPLPSSGLLWHAFVPGLRQIERGQWRGAVFAGSLLFLGAAAYKERELGSRLADSYWNNPVFLLPVMASTSGPVVGGLYLRRAEEKRRYETHQRNQRYLIGAAALLYGIQTADALLWTSETTAVRLVPGGFALQVSLQ